MPIGAERLHQAQKPLALMRDLLGILPSGARILDPFCGSGTTLVAAADMGMDAVGIEIVPEYAQIARDRVKRLDIGK
jgi:site-specific DNA-methyltransferase (adenine-specific)